MRPIDRMPQASQIELQFDDLIFTNGDDNDNDNDNDNDDVDIDIDNDNDDDSD